MGWKPALPEQLRELVEPDPVLLAADIDPPPLEGAGVLGRHGSPHVRGTDRRRART
jgi:hypothetical protein